VEQGDEQLAVGTRFTLEGASIAALVLQTRGPVRFDSFDDAPGPIAARFTFPSATRGSEEPIRQAAPDS
jgi:hypothetical protein